MKSIINYSLWISFIGATALIYFFESSGEFSFVLTLACGIQCFGFGLVYITIRSTKSSEGLSRNTFICYSQTLFSRLLSIILFEGYLPADASGDYVYRFFELLSFIFCFLTIFKIKPTDELYKWYYFAPVMLILAICIHPGLNGLTFFDIAWTYALYLESVALLPQIHMFTKREGVIDYHTSNFVITQTLNKAICLLFWIFTYQELNHNHDNDSISMAPYLSGYFVLGAQILSIIITGDFVALYLNSWRQGVPLVMLPH